MTVSQFNAIMDGKSFKDDVVFILASENTKINSTRFEKVEIDEGNNLLKAYILHPKSTAENPIYVESFVIDLDHIIAFQFKNGFGNDLLNGLQNVMLTDY